MWILRQIKNFFYLYLKTVSRRFAFPWDGFRCFAFICIRQLISAHGVSTMSHAFTACWREYQKWEGVASALSTLPVCEDRKGWGSRWHISGESILISGWDHCRLGDKVSPKRWDFWKTSELHGIREERELVETHKAGAKVGEGRSRQRHSVNVCIMKYQEIRLEV